MAGVCRYVWLVVAILDSTALDLFQLIESALRKGYLLNLFNHGLGFVAPWNAGCSMQDLDSLTGN